MTVLAVTGLAAEARLAEKRGLPTICAGGDPQRTAARLAETRLAGVTGLLSFGIAGGLKPGLSPGTLVVAESVLAEDGSRYLADAAWTAAVRRSIAGTARDVLGADRIVASAAEKARLYRQTGAAAVDLESVAVARHAGRAGLPFIVLRAIADPADRELPAAACLPLLADGRADLPAVIRSILAAPRQLPALVRTALDARAGLAGLRRALRSAGPQLVHGPAE